MKYLSKTIQHCTVSKFLRLNINYTIITFFYYDNKNE